MNIDQWLTLAALVVPGFTACAEFGSYAFVHPVVRRLPLEHHVAVEQGLVRTFGQFMPIAMPLSLLIIIAWASATPSSPVRWVVVAAWALGVITTVVVNVGINAKTAKINAEEVSAANWRDIRARWEWFQAFRSWAFLAAFLFISVAAAGLA